MSLCLYVPVCVCLSVVHLSVCLSVVCLQCLCVCMSLCVSVCLWCVCLSVVCLSVVSVCLCVCLYVCMCVCICQWRDHWMQAVYYVTSRVTVSASHQFTLHSFHDEYRLWFDVSQHSRYHTHTHTYWQGNCPNTLLLHCMECRHGLAMRILSVCLSVHLSNVWIVTIRK